MQNFLLDERLALSSLFLANWPLSSILLKNTRHYPWLILVPRRNNVSEINQLSKADRYALMDEIAGLSTIIEHYFKPAKLNLGSLGNIVSQLHVHLVARFTEDVSWPFGVWQKNGPTDEPYSSSSPIPDDLCQLIAQYKL